MLEETAQGIAQIIREIVARPDASEVPLALETTLLHGEMGLDSIDQIQIAVKLKERWDIEIPADDRGANAIFHSLATLAAFVEAERRRR